MFVKDYTSDFLNLQGVKVTSIQKINNCIFVYLESTQDRPSASCIIHDYRVQKINYGVFNKQNIFLILKKEDLKINSPTILLLKSLVLFLLKEELVI